MWYIDVYKIVWRDIIWINTSFQRNLFFKKNFIADFCCTLPFGIQESLGQVPYLPYFPKWTERVSTQMTTALLRFLSFFLTLLSYITSQPQFTLSTLSITPLTYFSYISLQKGAGLRVTSTEQSIASYNKTIHESSYQEWTRLSNRKENPKNRQESEALFLPLLWVLKECQSTQP